MKPGQLVFAAALGLSAWAVLVLLLGVVGWLLLFGSGVLIVLYAAVLMASQARQLRRQRRRRELADSGGHVRRRWPVSTR